MRTLRFTLSHPGLTTTIVGTSNPAHLAANLASIVVFIRKGQGYTILRAKRDALWGLPTTWRERRALGARRQVTPEALLQRMQRGNLLVWAYRRVLAAVGLRR